MPEATSFAELIFETLSGVFKKKDEVHHHHEYAFLTITINEFIRREDLKKPPSLLERPPPLKLYI